MPSQCVWLLLVLLVAAGCGTGSEPSATEPRTGPAELESLPGTPFRNDPHGFQGDVHPLIDPQSQLAVTATWSRVGTGRARELGYFPDRFYAPFRSLQVRQPERVFTARDFSGLMPVDVPAVGDVWSLDRDKVAEFVRQFHATASLHPAAAGRRAGPDGAFGVLRAISETHLDIHLRIHVEFDLEPGVWLTPASLTGRLLVNRQTGVVEFFKLALPSDRALNTTLTVRLPTEALIDIVRVEQMSLIGGDESRIASLAWDEEITESVAEQKLKQVFYRFLAIDWIPLPETLATARERKKPICAVVVWGGLDEQSC